MALTGQIPPTHGPGGGPHVGVLMPAYHIEFTSGSGAQRATFSIDDERPLGDQLRLVIEELRSSGHVLQGGPSDRLAVSWDGRDLDSDRTPMALGISPDRAIQLEMRAPRRAVKMVRPEGKIGPFLTRTAAFGPVAGAWSGLAAWIAVDIWRTRAGVPASGLDLWIPPVLGASLGIGLFTFWAIRRDRPWLWEAAMGGLLGLLTGALYAELLRRGLWSWTGSWGRLWAWSGLGASLGLGLAIRWAHGDRTRLWSGLGWGLGSGLAGGLLLLWPGGALLWNVAAFAVVGVGVAIGVIALPAQRSFAVLELLGVGGTPATGRRWREWDLTASNIPLSGGAGVSDAARLLVDEMGVRVAAGSNSGVPIRVAHRPFDPDEALKSQDQIQVGDAWYRLRKRRVKP